mgnify:CR=1 FL=1
MSQQQEQTFRKGLLSLRPIYIHYGIAHVPSAVRLCAKCCHAVTEHDCPAHFLITTSLMLNDPPGVAFKAAIDVEVCHSLVWVEWCEGFADDRASTHQLITLHVGYEAAHAPVRLLVVQPDLQAACEQQHLCRLLYCGALIEDASQAVRHERCTKPHPHYVCKVLAVLERGRDGRLHVRHRQEPCVQCADNTSTQVYPATCAACSVKGRTLHFQVLNWAGDLCTCNKRVMLSVHVAALGTMTGMTAKLQPVLGQGVACRAWHAHDVARPRHTVTAMHAMHMMWHDLVTGVPCLVRPPSREQQRGCHSSCSCSGQ